MKNEFLINRIQLLESIVFAKDNILNSNFRFVSFFYLWVLWELLPMLPLLWTMAVSTKTSKAEIFLRVTSLHELLIW